MHNLEEIVSFVFRTIKNILIARKPEDTYGLI